MCNNAMEYNHVETIYYKAAKKLLHVGTKFLQPEKIRSLRHMLPFVSEIPREELGFELSGAISTEEIKIETNLDLEDCVTANIITPVKSMDTFDDKKKVREVLFPLTKFEAIADDLSPDEILAQVQIAAAKAKQKLSTKVVGTQMGKLYVIPSPCVASISRFVFILDAKCYQQSRHAVEDRNVLTEHKLDTISFLYSCHLLEIYSV